MANTRLHFIGEQGSYGGRVSGLLALCLAGFLASGMVVTLAGCASSAKTAPLTDSSEAAASNSPLPDPGPAERESLVRIPAGTSVHVRLLQSISSRSARSGDEFQAELAEPITSAGAAAFPKGSRVRGRVVSARPSGRLHSPGHLRLALDSVQASGGRWVPFSSTSISVSGGNHARRNETLIGGGGGVGALIGGLAGGGLGLAVGAASGAGAGLTGAFITGRKDVSFSPESRLTFKTTREVSLRQ